jgi:hypothetical protein
MCTRLSLMLRIVRKSLPHINHIKFFSASKSSEAVASLPQWKLRHCIYICIYIYILYGCHLLRDVYKAFVDAQNSKKIIAAQRSDTVFNRCIWMKTTAIADSIDIELSKPRTVGRMTNRANAAFAEDSYLVIWKLRHCIYICIYIYILYGCHLLRRLYNILYFL